MVLNLLQRLTKQGRHSATRVLASLMVLGTFCCAHGVQAAEGDLDTTFGVGGKVTTPVATGANDDAIYAIAVQSDGKIVALGTAYSPSTSHDFALARYNPDGTIDEFFGVDGKTTTHFGNTAIAQAVALQSDGKIVVAGAVNPGAANENFVLARYNSNGSLDTTFGVNGAQLTDFGDTDSANALALQSDGGIVLAGTSTLPRARSNFALARYTKDGILDTSFGAGGKQTTDFNGHDDLAYGVAFQNDNKIVVVGSARSQSTFYDFALARYNTDGSLDTSFSDDGKQITAFGSAGDDALAMAIQNDGKIVAAGRAHVDIGTASDFALALHKHQHRTGRQRRHTHCQ